MTAPLMSDPLTYGLVGATSIAGNVSAAGWKLVYVTLSSNYARAPVAGYPDPSPGAGAGNSWTAFAQTIPSGTRLQLWTDEAAALVAAGAASYS